MYLTFFQKTVSSQPFVFQHGVGRVFIGMEWGGKICLEKRIVVHLGPRHSCRLGTSVSGPLD